MSYEPNCARPDSYNEGWSFFGPDWTTPASHQFLVGRDPVILTVVGLTPTQCVTIESVFGCAAGDEFVPLVPDCHRSTVMTRCNTTLIVPLSGRYRLRMSDTAPGPLDPSTITVYGRPQFVAPGYGGSEMSGCNSCPSSAQITTSSVDNTVAIVRTGDNLDFGTNPLAVTGEIVSSPPSVALLCAAIQACIPVPTSRTLTATDGTINVTPTATGFDIGTSPVVVTAEIAASPAAVAILAAALCDDLGPCIDARVPASLPPSGPASGALTGTYPSPGINPAFVTILATVVLTDAFNLRIGAIFP